MFNSIYKRHGNFPLDEKKQVPVISPDHISLGQCATTFHFSRKYATIKDQEVIDILGGDCDFLGFKKINIQSLEEELFANMHHLLEIRSKFDKKIKELCIMRQNEVDVQPPHIGKSNCRNFAVADINSIVVIKMSHLNIELFFFNKRTLKKFSMPYDDDYGIARMCGDKLYLVNINRIKLVNFEDREPFVKVLPSYTSEMSIVCMANEMVVMYQKVEDNKALLYSDLKEASELKLLQVENELIDSLINESNKFVICTSYDRMFWVIMENESFSFYKFIAAKKEVEFIKRFDMKIFFPNATGFTCNNSIYHRSTRQLFLLYEVEEGDYPTCFVLVFDMISFNVSSLMKMELTLKKNQEFKICCSRDGTKLFVQVTFENKVIFYQVFSLLPQGLSLLNIVTCYLRKNMHEDFIIGANLPKVLKEEVLEGF